MTINNFILKGDLNGKIVVVRFFFCRVYMDLVVKKLVVRICYQVMLKPKVQETKSDSSKRDFSAPITYVTQGITLHTVFHTVIHVSLYTFGQNYSKSCQSCYIVLTIDESLQF